MSLVVVLDLDDTLYLERDFVASGFAAVGDEVERRFGVAGFGAIAWQRFLDGDRGNVIDLVLADLELVASTEDIRHLVEVYRSHPPTLSLPSDALTFLDAIAARAEVAVLTDGWPRTQRNKLSALGLGRMQNQAVVTDELGGPEFRKPHRAGFLAVEAHFHRAPTDRYVYLADNPGKDRDGALAAGWSFVRIRRTGGLHHAIPSPIDTLETSCLVDALPYI
jgi:putative hydrolase of the HAD superfamily